MSKRKQEVVYKKRGKYYYYMTKTMTNFKSTEKTTKAEAESYVTELAEKYSISRGTIYLWIDQRKKGRLTFDDRVINNAIRRFNEDHWGVKEIAREFGVSVPTVYAWLRMKDVPMDEIRQIEFDDVVIENDTTKDRMLIDTLKKEVQGLKEQNKKLREEVELYKGLLSKLNTFIDKTSPQQ